MKNSIKAKLMWGTVQVALLLLLAVAWSSAASATTCRSDDCSRDGHEFRHSIDIDHDDGEHRSWNKRIWKKAKKKKHSWKRKHSWGHSGDNGSSNSSSIEYGDFTGSSVMYLDVTETANSPGDQAPLFGAPSIIGDTLDFDPRGFSASAMSGRSDLTDGQLNITLMSAPGGYISSLSVSERGDYSLIGTGGAATQVAYGLSIASIVAIAVDGVALDTPIVLPGASASGGSSLDQGASLLQLWDLLLSYDVNAALVAADVTFSEGATKLEIVLDNQLAAISEKSSIASISKKDFQIHVEVVPEPSTAILIGLGLLGLGVSRKRSA